MQLRDNVLLYPHQVRGSNFAIEARYSINCFGPGLGKTLTAMSAMGRVGIPTLIISPAYLTHNWMREIEKFTTLKPIRFSSALKIPSKFDVIVASYNDLKFMVDLFEKVNFVVCDEVHYLKNVDSQRTNLFYDKMLKNKPLYFLGLSGTPVKNRIPEIYSLLRILEINEYVKPKISEKYPSYFNFCYYFTNPRQVKIGHRYVTKFDGSRNLSDLKTYLNNFLKLRDDEIINLPEVVEQTIEVDYKETGLSDAWETFKNTGSADIMAKAENALAKSTFTAELVEDLMEETEKVIVFSDHRRSSHNLKDILSKKFKVFLITGEVSIDKRDVVLEEFRKCKDKCVLVCTIGSCSVGVNLVESNYLVFNDISWVPGDNIQALKRVHRIGQTKTCQIYYVVGSKTDSIIHKTITSKQSTIGKLL